MPSRSRQLSIEILAGCQTHSLLWVNKENGIYFGDIICQQGQIKKSLKCELVKFEILEDNISIFEGKLFKYHIKSDAIN